MRQFTQEEKELIVNTPITKDCFERFVAMLPNSYKGVKLC